MAGPAYDAIRVDAVDADAVAAELGGEQSDLVGLVGLRRAVGHVVRPGEQTVLAGDVDNVAASTLRPHDPGRLAGHQERAARHDVVLHVPVPASSSRRVVWRWTARRCSPPGRPRRRPAPPSANATAMSSSDVTSATTERATSVSPSSAATVAAAPGVEIGHHHCRALGGQPVGDGPADARSPAGDQRDPRRKWLRCGQPGQFGHPPAPSTRCGTSPTRRSACRSTSPRRRASR